MAKTIILNVGHTYALSTASGCTVTDADGVQVTAVAAGTQGVFNPPTPEITLSDENAKVIPFVDAPAFFTGPGGGSSITIDPNPTQGSGNAVSSGGVYTALRELPAPAPTALTPTTAMKNGGVYTVAADIDARTVTLVEHATATIVVSAADGPIPNMQLPAWKWCTDDGLLPALDYFRVYRMEVMDDGFYTSARLVSQYATASEWMYTKWANGAAAYVAGRDINLVREETHAIENSTPWCWFDGGTVIKGFANNTTALDGSELDFDITRGNVQFTCVATLEFSTEKKFKAIALRYRSVGGSSSAAPKYHFMFQVRNADTGEWVDACDLVTTAGGNSLEKYIVKIKTDIKSNKWRLVAEGPKNGFSQLRFFEA